MRAVSPSLASAAGNRSPRSGGARRDTARMASRVTSSTFVGRTTELVELRGALTEAVGGRPSLAFVAGESGVGKTRLLSELERAARADGIRVIGGDCVELGEGELPYAPIVGALRPLARSGAPGLQGALRRRPRRARPDPPRPRRDPPRRRGDRAGAPVRRPARAAGAARGRRRADGHDRGPALGRPLDARVPRLPRELAVPASACWSSPPTAPTSCTAATRCARCWPSSSATPATAASSCARSPARSSAQQLSDILGEAPGRRPARRACSRAARATRCSPRSCWRPARTAAARCRRRCATR